MRNLFDRLASVGDLWLALRTGPTVDLRAVLQYAEPGQGPTGVARHAKRVGTTFPRGLAREPPVQGGPMSHAGGASSLPLGPKLTG